MRAEPSVSLRNPRVSVVLPAFDAQAFLRLAVESILDQTFSDFELVVVDDGSSDATPSILAEYAERDDRVHVFRQDNCGGGASLNRGLTLARAPYIARMDTDDVSKPDRLRLAG